MYVVYVQQYNITAYQKMLHPFLTENNAQTLKLLKKRKQYLLHHQIQKRLVQKLLSAETVK